MARGARGGSWKSSRLAQWIEDHAGPAKRLLRSRAKQKADADDALQETVLSILKLDDEQLAKVKNPQAYICAVASRKLGALQAADAIPPSAAQHLQQAPQDLNPDQLLNSLHFEEVLTEDLDRLPALHRKVLILKCEGLSYAEIARECSLQLHDVARILHEARTAMQPTSKKL